MAAGRRDLGGGEPDRGRHDARMQLTSQETGPIRTMMLARATYLVDGDLSAQRGKRDGLRGFALPWTRFDRIGLRA
jgi:hypothetical protein